MSTKMKLDNIWMNLKMKLDNIWMNFSFHPFQMMGKLLLKMDEEQIHVVMLLTEVSCLDEIGVVFDTDIGILPESMKLSASSSLKWLEEDEFYET